MKEGFIFCFVVGYFEENLENILELFSLRGDEEYACSSSAQL